MKDYWLLPCLFVLCLSFILMQGKLQTTQLKLDYPSHQVKAQTIADHLQLAEQKQESAAPSLSDLRNKYESTFLMNGPKTKREIALTFDDAPDTDFTPKILEILKEKDVKATFFLVGHRIEKYPDIAKRIVNDGHAIGNHSYNHPNFATLSDENFRKEIIKTDKLIHSFTGFTPSIVRPPYGNISERQLKWLATKQKKVVNWNVDSLDWKGIDAKEIANNVLPNVNPGSIILQHSGTGFGGDLSGTVKALPKIIDELKSEGFKMVTVQEMLDIPVN